METNNETVADIVREMRENKGFPVPFAPTNAVWIDDFKAYADRIEAAHKREVREVVVSKIETTTKENLAVGNAAKLRDACEKADAILTRISKSAWFIDANFGETVEFVEAGEAIRQALAEPPRQCDVGTAAEQAERFGEHCQSFLNRDGIKTCTGCPCCGVVKYGKCEFAWAQMRYMEGSAK